jgi:hypothetical protein
MSFRPNAGKNVPEVAASLLYMTHVRRSTFPEKETDRLVHHMVGMSLHKRYTRRYASSGCPEAVHVHRAGDGNGEHAMPGSLLSGIASASGMRDWNQNKTCAEEFARQLSHRDLYSSVSSSYLKKMRQRGPMLRAETRSILVFIFRPTLYFRHCHSARVIFLTRETWRCRPLKRY